jgi:hypothetical protein
MPIGKRIYRSYTPIFLAHQVHTIKYTNVYEREDTHQVCQLFKI